jgi:protein-S-isoprenylcysteine O-methyltransferase Ste14
MIEGAPSDKALHLLKGFKNLIGGGLPLLFVSLLLEVIVISVRRWIFLPVPLTINIRIILTIPCILVSVLGLIWFTCSLNLVNIHYLAGEIELITHGPNNYVRHPLYSKLLMGLPPLLIIWYADLMLIILWLLIFIISQYFVKLEERDLIDSFGDDYKNYMKYV